jgi:hypothetical protein
MVSNGIMMFSRWYYIVPQQRRADMAEFCLECWNKENDTNLLERDVVISKNLDLCEGCAKMKHTIVCCKNEKKISFRIPKSLHADLVNTAKDEGISLNQFILYKLAK